MTGLFVKEVVDIKKSRVVLNSVDDISKAVEKVKRILEAN